MTGNKSVGFQEGKQITAVDTAQNNNNTTVGKQAKGLNEVSLSMSLQIPCASPLHRLAKLGTLPCALVLFGTQDDVC